MKAELYVSTTSTDADWIVKVIDVYPDSAQRNYSKNVEMGGYQMLVRAGVLRGKFRNSFEKPEPFTPSKITKIEVDLPDIQHCFLSGHKIMIQIQSSFFPLIDRNPQTFCNIYKADEKYFVKATHRLFHSAKYPSAVNMSIIKDN